MLTAHELFGFMSPELSRSIIDFTAENDRDLYRATLASVADAKKVRPVFLERKSKTDRHQDMAQMLSKPRLDLAAGTLLRGWLIKKNNLMLTTFLDALGVEHKEGAVDDLPPAMDTEKLKAAITTLLEKFPQEEVAVYLNAFYSMNEVPWDNLKQMLQEDPRLQLG